MTSYPNGDPRLKTPAWKAIQEYWRDQVRRNDVGCARCGGDIDPTDRNQGPYSLVVGHITERDTSDDDTIDNTQPECKRCSDKSGPAYKQQRDAGSKYTHTRNW